MPESVAAKPLTEEQWASRCTVHSEIGAGRVGWLRVQYGAISNSGRMLVCYGRFGRVLPPGPSGRILEVIIHDLLVMQEGTEEGFDLPVEIGTIYVSIPEEGLFGYESTFMAIEYQTQVTVREQASDGS